MYNPAPIFKFVEAQQAKGQAVVLVTIADASASSSRNPGAHLAVSADGNMAGSLTGGCIEAAVAAEALDVLQSGQPRMTRYGQGSRYLDIRLPCGGSLDLLFSPVQDRNLGVKLVERLTNRTPFKITSRTDRHGDYSLRWRKSVRCRTHRVSPDRQPYRATATSIDRPGSGGRSITSSGSYHRD